MTFWTYLDRNAWLLVVLVLPMIGLAWAILWQRRHKAQAPAIDLMAAAFERANRAPKVTDKLAAYVDPIPAAVVAVRATLTDGEWMPLSDWIGCVRRELAVSCCVNDLDASVVKNEVTRTLDRLCDDRLMADMGQAPKEGEERSPGPYRRIGGKIHTERESMAEHKAKYPGRA